MNSLFDTFLEFYFKINIIQTKKKPVVEFYFDRGGNLILYRTNSD